MGFQDQRTSGWGCGLKVFRIKECPFQGLWKISGNSCVSSKNRQRTDGLKDRFFGEFFDVFENHNYGLKPAALIFENCVSIGHIYVTLNMRVPSFKSGEPCNMSSTLNLLLSLKPSLGVVNIITLDENFVGLFNSMSIITITLFVQH
jgi:hypothetical protein